MTQATTPTIVLHFKHRTIDLAKIEKFYITIKQNDKRMVTKTDPIVDNENKTLTITLTQAETNVFKEGEAEIQVRGRFDDNNVFATKVKRIPINRALCQEVL